MFTIEVIEYESGVFPRYFVGAEKETDETLRRRSHTYFGKNVGALLRRRKITNVPTDAEASLAVKVLKANYKTAGAKVLKMNSEA